MAGREKRAADRIRRAPLAPGSRRVQAWAELRVYRRRACRENQQDGQVLRRDVRDSVISKDLKKVR
jgi:hypothetical protein